MRYTLGSEVYWHGLRAAVQIRSRDSSSRSSRIGSNRRTRQFTLPGLSSSINNSRKSQERAALGAAGFQGGRLIHLIKMVIGTILDSTRQPKHCTENFESTEVYSYYSTLSSTVDILFTGQQTQPLFSPNLSLRGRSHNGMGIASILL